MGFISIKVREIPDPTKKQSMEAPRVLPISNGVNLCNVRSLVFVLCRRSLFFWGWVAWELS